MPLAVVGFDARTGHHFRDAAMAEGAVVFIFGDVEIDVAVERIGVTLFDQPADVLEGY